MTTYDIFSLQSNLASLETTVGFRVWGERNELRYVVRECEITLEGRYDDPGDDALEAAIVAAYEEAFPND